MYGDARMSNGDFAITTSSFECLGAKETNRCDTATKSATVFLILLATSVSHTSWVFSCHCSAETRLQPRLCRPSGESVREHAGQRHIGSLDSVACVDTAKRRNQHQKWRNHGYKESVTMNDCLSECWTSCGRGCYHRASTEWVMLVAVVICATSL